MEIVGAFKHSKNHVILEYGKQQNGIVSKSERYS